MTAANEPDPRDVALKRLAHNLDLPESVIGLPRHWDFLPPVPRGHFDHDAGCVRDMDHHPSPCVTGAIVRTHTPEPVQNDEPWIKPDCGTCGHKLACCENGGTACICDDVETGADI